MTPHQKKRGDLNGVRPRKINGVKHLESNYKASRARAEPTEESEPYSVSVKKRVPRSAIGGQIAQVFRGLRCMGVKV